jgi:hypothetical protein
LIDTRGGFRVYFFPNKPPRRRPLMDNLASTPFKRSQQSRYYCDGASRYYRDRASAIRARLTTLQDDEVFSELYLLAAHYERLAEFAESSGSLGRGV